MSGSPIALPVRCGRTGALLDGNGFEIGRLNWSDDVNYAVKAINVHRDIVAALELSVAALETARPWIESAIGSIPAKYQEAIEAARAALVKIRIEPVEE